MSGPSPEEVRAEHAYRGERARRLFMAGRVKGGMRDVAYYCSWGDHWFSIDDEERADRGALVSHGLCKACKAHVEGRDLRLEPAP